MNNKDYGYSSISWEEANFNNIKLVEAEYRERLDGTLKDFQDIDKKSQFVLTGLIGLITAILGLGLSQSKNIDSQHLIGILTLASMFGVGAIFATFSVFPRTYAHFGVTPSDLNVAEWSKLLLGNEKDACRLSGVRIKEYARAIEQHNESNRKKSYWLKLALIATVASPISAVLFTAAATLVLRNAPHTGAVTPIATAAVCPPHPAIAAPIAIIGVIGLLLGAITGALLRRTIVPRH